MGQRQLTLYLFEYTKFVSDELYLVEYLFFPSHYLLKEVHVGRCHWREVGLAILEQEIVELLLALHFAAQGIYIHSI